MIDGPPRSARHQSTPFREPADLQPVFRREPSACRALVHALMPGVEARLHAVLSRVSRPPVDREKLAELAQEVFVVLFEEDCKVLRSWDPSKGANLNTFVGRVAERVALGILRSGRRSGWREDPTESETMEALSGGAPALDGEVVDRDHLRKLLDALKENLSPRGVELFIALYAEEREVDDVATRFEMTPNAVYVWRNRLKALLADLNARLLRESAAGAPGRA